MHCTHSCGSLVKQFPISNEPDLTICPRKHCRKQDAAADGPVEAAADGPVEAVADGPARCAGGCRRTAGGRTEYSRPVISPYLIKSC